ncbi:MAG TPA: sodium:calcium antiporter, partial [Pseudomonas sp.]|nr:sodium:calcium antiporter [Pseudomonas sp.]
GRPLAEVFGDAMIGYVVPLTMVTLLVISGRAWKTQRN